MTGKKHHVAYFLLLSHRVNVFLPSCGVPQNITHADSKNILHNVAIFFHTHNDNKKKLHGLQHTHSKLTDAFSINLTAQKMCQTNCLRPD